MIDDSILKSNFIGRDGFRWWIGQIPPVESEKGQANGKGWGNRKKVRILGYHPYSTVELPDEDLPWAQVMMPTTSGSGAANYAVNPKLRQGDIVVGFFLDGDSAQVPVIMGCFGRTDQVPSKEFKGAFIPFTGYTNRVKKPNGTLYESQSSEGNSKAQKSPRALPPDTVDKLNSKSENKDERYFFSGVGKQISLADSGNDNTAKNIGVEVHNLIQKVNDPTNKLLKKASEISRSVEKIMGIAEGIVGQCTDVLYTGLIKILQAGLKALYKAVYAAVFAATANPVAAHLAGVAAQKAMAIPVSLLQGFIAKIPGIVINNLFGIVRGMLTDVVNNVTRPSPCVSTQFAASVIKEIINKIQSGLSGVLGGVSKILSAGFSVVNFLTSGVAALRGISGLFDKNQNKNKSANNTDLWVIGVGAKNTADKVLQFKNILDSMNNASASAKNAKDAVKAGYDIFTSATSDLRIRNQPGRCYSGPIVGCTSPPKIKLFGGSGKNGDGEVILGNFVTANGETTAGIIGVKVKNNGKNYKYPPFVQIEDECEQGYGAVIGCNIDDNGSIENFYIISPGENYPIGNPNINTGEQVSESNPSNIPNYVSGVAVLKPGYGYEQGDTASDDVGNTYSLIIEDGSIIGASVNSTTPENVISTPENVISTPERIINNYIPVQDLLEITIQSDTGVGAILQPILDKLPNEIITGREQTLRSTSFVKDCIE